MVFARVIALVLAVVVVREAVRWLVQRGSLRAMFDVSSPGSLRRRTLAIVAGLAATYLAVVALAFVYARGYGLPTGTSRYAVGEVLADGASAGKLATGDLIEAIDGEPVFIGRGPSLVERVNAKSGAPVAVHVRRAGEAKIVQVEPRRGTDKQGRPSWQLGIRPSVENERSTDGAFAFAFGFPVHHARSLVSDLFGNDEPEVGGPVRIVEEFRFDRQQAGALVLMAALSWAGHLLLLFALLDLVRLAIVIRDRLRA